jgi:hypothetical protein
MESLKNEIIGDKSVMAIEYTVLQKKPYIMGNLVLWINDIYIGAFEDEQMLINIAHSLERLPVTIPNNNEFYKMSRDEIYHLLNKENEGYLVSLGEGFDDFLIYSYATGDDLNFIWKLLDEPFFNYPDYPNGLQFAKISKNVLINMVEKFKVNLFS